MTTEDVINYVLDSFTDSSVLENNELTYTVRNSIILFHKINCFYPIIISIKIDPIETEDTFKITFYERKDVLKNTMYIDFSQDHPVIIRKL